MVLPALTSCQPTPSRYQPDGLLQPKQALPALPSPKAPAKLANSGSNTVLGPSLDSETYQLSISLIKGLPLAQPPTETANPRARRRNPSPHAPGRPASLPSQPCSPSSCCRSCDYA